MVCKQGRMTQRVKPVSARGLRELTAGYQFLVTWFHVTCLLVPETRAAAKLWHCLQHNSRQHWLATVANTGPGGLQGLQHQPGTAVAGGTPGLTLTLDTALNDGVLTLQ